MFHSILDEKLKREKDPVLEDRQKSKKELERAKLELDNGRKELAIYKHSLREIRVMLSFFENCS